MSLDWDSTTAESAAPEQARVADPPALRLLRPKDGPTLSIILVTRRTRAELNDGLPSLVLACSQLGAELIIVAADGRPANRSINRHVRFVVASADATVSQLRALAMQHATGDIVMLLDEDAALSKAGVDRLRAWGRRADARGTDEVEHGLRADVAWQAYLNRAVAQPS
jgi:hypothetical protein